MQDDKKDEEINEPGDLIYNAAKIASEMDTTLWFTDKDRDVERLKNLVACGQFTACYNLLKYCVDLRKAEVDVDRELLDQMIRVFQHDWNAFIKDPYYQHDFYLQGAREVRNVG